MANWTTEVGTWSALVCVLILVGVLGLFVVRRKAWRNRVQSLQQELDNCRRQMDEVQQRLWDKEEALKELGRENARLQEALLKETETRAGLFQENRRIPLLEEELRRERQAVRELSERLEAAQREKAVLETSLRKEREAHQERLAAYEHARDRMTQAFDALASEALQKNTKLFLQLARNALSQFQDSAASELEQKHRDLEQILSPLSEALQRYEKEIQEMERQRQQAYARLTQQVESLSIAQARLVQETGKLVQALRQPQVRGRWGELTLRRVVELAGLSEHCDFSEQPTTQGATGLLRPDLVVHLPGDRVVVVDAKVPLQSYLDAVETASEEERKKHLQNHARQLRNHIQQLATKNYWNQFSRTPDFVVLFVPGEAFFSAALEQDPELIEAGIQQRIVLATPTTLIALLRAVAYGWHQQRMARNAEVIGMLGRELHDRLRGMVRYLRELGTHLDRAVHSYNRTVGTMERRVLVTARRFGELGLPLKEEIPVLEEIHTQPRNAARKDSDAQNDERMKPCPNPSTKN